MHICFNSPGHFLLSFFTFFLARMYSSTLLSMHNSWPLLRRENWSVRACSFIDIQISLVMAHMSSNLTCPSNTSSAHFSSSTQSYKSLMWPNLLCQGGCWRCFPSLDLVKLFFDSERERMGSRWHADGANVVAIFGQLERTSHLCLFRERRLWERRMMNVLYRFLGSSYRTTYIWRRWGIKHIEPWLLHVHVTTCEVEGGLLVHGDFVAHWPTSPTWPHPPSLFIFFSPNIDER